MLGQIDRYIKQAIVDNNETVSSAALLCGLQLVGVCAGRFCIVHVGSRWVHDCDVLCWYCVPAVCARCD